MPSSSKELVQEKDPKDILKQMKELLEQSQEILDQLLSDRELYDRLRHLSKRETRSKDNL